MSDVDYELIGIIAGSIVGGIIILLILSCMVCTVCWGCIFYQSLNKLWDLAGKAVDRMDRYKRGKNLRKSRSQFDEEVGVEMSDVEVEETDDGFTDSDDV